MPVRNLSSLCLAALIAACTSEPATSTNDQATADGPGAAVQPNGDNEMAPDGNASAAPRVAPGEVAQASWTGRFAATQDLCRYGAWNIGRERIVTGGETSCSVVKAEESGSSVVLTLACVAEGNATDERWTLTPEPGDALAVRRDTGREIVEVDLRRCT
jgi:hypothetical protein